MNTAKTVKSMTTVIILLTLILVPTKQAKGQRDIFTAHADIVGAPGSGVYGRATLIQSGTELLPTVLIVVEVFGLEPGTVHGCHIHETGKCEPNFKAAGGHFDPGPYGMTNPDANHPFHMGDIPNLTADEEGRAFFEHRTSRITLSAGPLSLFDEDGSAIIVHVDPDMGTTGQKGGAGGARLACGIIERE